MRRLASFGSGRAPIPGLPATSVYGVSTQRADELAAFAGHEGLPFPLLSDAGGQLTAALRLPVFRAGGVDRLKRATFLVDQQRIIRRVMYPVTDPAGSVTTALDLIDQAAAGVSR